MISPPPLETPPAGKPFHPWLGVFETLRVARGRAFFIEEHWQSLQASCLALGLPCETDFRRAAGTLPAADGRWRWVVSGDGGARQIFTPEHLPARPRGLTLTLSRVRVGTENLDARHKTLSYLAHWQARRENPVGESLLLNEHGHVASGAMTNIFWFHNGTLCTPDESCGCRAGVTRAWVLAQAPMPVCIVRRAKPAALGLADEIFLTNSLLGLCPVRQWQDRRLPAPGPQVRTLRRLYRLACQKQLR